MGYSWSWWKEKSVAGFSVLAAWITYNPCPSPLWMVPLATADISEASMGPHLHFHGEPVLRLHSPSQWNCPQHSQESRWLECPQWQDRWWPSELLLPPTGYQLVPQPGPASALACLLHIDCKAGGGVKTDFHLAMCWGLHSYELWIQGWFHHQPTLRGCHEGLSYLLSLELVSSQQHIALGNMVGRRLLLPPSSPTTVLSPELQQGLSYVL